MDIIELSSFMSKVDTSGECWLWTGATDDRGYGRHYDPRHKATRRAHQQMFEAIHGYLPVEILHSCDTPGCVKPTHLKAGTHVDNMRDMAAKGRSATTSLTPDDVRHIRSTYVAGRGGTSGVLQKAYGISRHTVRQIALRQTWKDVK
jgi:ribosomal protein S14